MTKLTDAHYDMAQVIIRARAKRSHDVRFELRTYCQANKIRMTQQRVDLAFAIAGQRHCAGCGEFTQEYPCHKCGCRNVQDGEGWVGATIDRQ